MHNNDWSLIFFTLLSQLSVGIMVLITVMYFTNVQIFNGLQSGGLFRTPQFIALLAIIAATIISFFHLGHPAHAFHSANNLGSSWLSREILGIGLFGVGVLFVFLQSIFKWDNQLLIMILHVYTALAGLFLVYFMSGIYMVPTIPAWHTWFTPFHFYMSALIIGGMIVAGFLLPKNDFSGFSIWIFKSIVLMLLLQLLAAFLYKNYLVRMEHMGIDVPDFQGGVYHTLYLVRLFMIFIAALFVAYLSLRVNSASILINPTMRFYGFVLFLIVVQEIIGRFMFYAGYYRLGV